MLSITVASSSPSSRMGFINTGLISNRAEEPMPTTPVFRSTIVIQPHSNHLSAIHSKPPSIPTPKSASGTSRSASSALLRLPRMVSSADIGCALTPESTSTGVTVCVEVGKHLSTVAVTLATLALFVVPTAHFILAKNYK
ncbi:hypothetical protein AGDE_05366 [Angomonas deanei]|nr:hypothetical protein AGDE_05366 [Angomonas deanei]|eukprot:EPY38563.1 hypothetical protein AGDE_05366 [Angomonas deanei]